MHSRNTLSFSLGLFLSVLLLITSCRKDNGPARWDVDVLLPLVNTSFTIADIVPDSLLVTDGAGNITLLYSSELFAVDLDTVLEAPDTSYFYPGAITFPGPVEFPPGTGIVDENNLTKFNFNDIRLRELILSEGTMELKLTNKVSSRVLGTFTLPGALFPDGSNSIVAAVDAGSPGTPSYSFQTKSLAGVRMDLTGPTFNAVNTLHTIVAINLDPNGPGATLTDQDSVNATVSYRGLRPAYARGFFGEQTIEVEPTESELDLFSNIVGGTLDLDEVALRVKLVNGIGMDIQVALGHLRAINSRTGTSVDLAHTLFQGPINLSRATDVGNGFVPTIYTNSMDNTDSNVDLFLENLPDKLSYALDLRLNPLGDISSGNDFIYSNSKVSAELELEVPLRLIANELTLQSFVDVDIPKGFRSGDLRFFATNGFPFTAGLQAHVVDANDHVVSNVAVQGLIATGILNSNDLVQTPVESELRAALSSEQVVQLKDGGRLRLRVVFNTADQSQRVQILDSYKLDLQVTLGANYEVNGE